MDEPNEMEELLTPAQLSAITHSSSLEHMLEHVFLAELIQEAWFGRGVTLDVLHSAVDAFGHDVVLECQGIVRHIQLKSRTRGGKTSRFKVHTDLSRRPSGCVIVLDWARVEGENRVNLQYLWFGDKPGQPLPELGAVVAKHAKGDAHGVKKPRPAIRVVAKGRFDALKDIAELYDRLFDVQ